MEQIDLLKPENPKRPKPNHREEWILVGSRDSPLLPVMPDTPVRTLKIEADGDSWKGIIKPKIRLMGRWLERAGFLPGSHVHVTCVAPGVIELRSLDVMIAKQMAQSRGDSAPR